MSLRDAYIAALDLHDTYKNVVFVIDNGNILSAPRDYEPDSILPNMIVVSTPDIIKTLIVYVGDEVIVHNNITDEELESLIWSL